MVVCINLNKSPLSGRHICDADLRRRAYAEKCERTKLLAALLNDEARNLDLELFEKRPCAEAKGATLVMAWSDSARVNRELCRLTLQRIGREEDAVSTDQRRSGLERRHHAARLNIILNRMKDIQAVLRSNAYGKTA